MSGKKIVIKIHEDGKINAETFGMVGTECALELDKLMKDLARTVTRTKKIEYFKEKISVKNKEKVNKNA